MLSPGRYHELVPREYEDNLEFRIRLLKLANRDPKYQAAIIEMCRLDILFWINAFVIQMNPNSIGSGSVEYGPFISWDYQDSAICDQGDEAPGILWCVDNRKRLLFEKSREMGITWLLLIVMTWLFLFHSRKKMLVISRSEAAVDKVGEDNSLFPKIDFILEHLPKWMLRGYVGGFRKMKKREDDDDAIVHRKKLFFRHPFTKSSIAGEATSERAGVGGRASMIFIDELSQIEKDREILDRTISTSNCVIMVGTHKGTTSAFYEESRKPTTRKRVLHWSQHPDKRKGLYRYNPACKSTNGIEVLDPGYAYPPDFAFVTDGSPFGGPYPNLRSPWYDAVRVDFSDQGASEDLDINPSGSMVQYFSAKVIYSLIEKAWDPTWEGDLLVDGDMGKPVELVVQKDGPFALWTPLTHDKRPPKARYTIGCDISHGRGRTNSCMTVFDAGKCLKVAEYVTPHMDPTRFANVAMAMCWLFLDLDGDPAWLCWEHAGPGCEFADRIVNGFGYRRVYMRDVELKIAGRKTSSPGFVPHDNTKYPVFGKYRAALGSSPPKFVNPSRKALEECLEFVEVAKKIEHARASKDESGARNNDKSGARVNHGDRVVADVLAYLMADEIGIGRSEVEVQVEEEGLHTLAGRRRYHEAMERERARMYA